MTKRALALLLVGAFACGTAHAGGRSRRAPASPSPAAPPSPEMLVRRSEVRAAIDQFELARARKLTARPPARGQPRDRELVVLEAEIDILSQKPADAARRLASHTSDRRAAWLACLSALASGDRKAGATLHALAAGTKPGEESQAELGWLLEGTLPRGATTRPAQLEEAAHTALNENRKPEAALALFACHRLGQSTAKLQVLMDRLAKPPAKPAVTPR